MSKKTFKDMVKSNFAGRYAISLLHETECFLLPKIISDEKAVKNYFKNKTGKELNLDNPVTFTEKLNWYKLNGHNPLMTKCADKLAVREYVKECGYENILNELYEVYDNANEIDIDKLPSQFVLKATHGSHMNIIVKDKNEVNWKQSKLLMNSWLRQDIYWSGREWVYKDIPRRIIAERYLEDEYGELRDYKIHCFNGEPKYIGVYSNRQSKLRKVFYDIEWKKLFFGQMTKM